MKTTHIYALADPRSHFIRYVGKSDRPNVRLRRHVREAKAGSPLHVHRWIRRLMGDGLRPKIVILEVCEESIWQEREKHWISEMRALGHRLTNTHEGGKGGVISKSMREKYLWLDEGWLRDQVSQGKTQWQIVNETGGSYKSVSSAFKRHDLPLAPRDTTNIRREAISAWYAKNPNLRRLTDVEYLRRRRSEGASYTQIARDVGCSAMSVHRACAQASIQKGA